LDLPSIPSASADSADKNKTQEYKIVENSFSNSDQFGKRRVGCAFILAVALGSCVITDLRAQVIW
jgi:hypothetical protein